jgi:hypothetical protein
MVVNLIPSPNVTIALTMEVQEAGIPVVDANTMNFQSGFDVTTDGYGKAIVKTLFPPQYLYFADQLDSPVNSNWVVNSLAPTTADGTNAALVIRRFADATESGVGFTAAVPSGAENISLTIIGRPSVAPGSTQAVVLALYRRTINTGIAISSWSSGLQLTTLSIPTNAFFQTYSQTISLSTLGLSAGTMVQFELTRLGANGSDTYTNNWNLLSLSVGFS